MRFFCLVWPCAVLSLAIPTLAGSPVILDTDDQAVVGQALEALQMTLTDPGFDKDYAPSILVSSHARRALTEPFTLTQLAGDMIGQGRTATRLEDIVDSVIPLVEWADSHHDTPTATAMANSALQQLAPDVAVAVQPIIDVMPAVLQQLAEARPAAPLEALNGWVAWALDWKADAPQLDGWDAAGLDTRSLRALLTRQENLLLADDEPERQLLEGAAEGTPRALAEAFRLLARAVDAAIEHLPSNDAATAFEQVFDTPYGKLIIGGHGTNLYRDDAWLIIDLGGDDVYENNAGGALGLVGRPVAIVIDRAGNDRYVGNRSFSQGAGVLGIGLLVDLAGDDFYEASQLSQGAGFWGCGLLADFSGTDRFTGGSHCQGAATFGLGILWQKSGDTRYTADSLAQGYAGPGGAGWLLEGGGDDTYLAQGVTACGWLPGHRFTLSQGFGYGMRPFAGGGCGVLTDLQGNDRYAADVYGQGASYWYAVGLLLDADGNDIYEAHQYCQGAGIHLSSGLVWDGNGNDQATAHAICQGAAHDYSVGFWIDRAGQDTYRGDSTAQGAAIHNSFALLLDGAGDDRYIGTDPAQSQAAGHDGGRREYGSIALLVDRGGRDDYSQGQPNNALWLKPSHGAGIDCEMPPSRPPRAAAWPARPSPRPTNPAEPLRAREVNPDHPLERLLRLAISGQPAAAVATEELLQAGGVALDYLLGRVDSPQVMIRVMTERLVNHLGTDAVPHLVRGLQTTPRPETGRLITYFLARLEPDPAAIPLVMTLLEDDESQAVALYTLGHWRVTAALAPAHRLLKSDREIVRLRAAQATGRIGSPAAVPYLIDALEDPVWSVRQAARDALVRIGPRGIQPLRAAFATASPLTRRSIAAVLTDLDYHRAGAMREIAWRAAQPMVRAAVRHAPRVPPGED